MTVVYAHLIDCISILFTRIPKSCASFAVLLRFRKPPSEDSCRNTLGSWERVCGLVFRVCTLKAC